MLKGTPSPNQLYVLISLLLWAYQRINLVIQLRTSWCNNLPVVSPAGGQVYKWVFGKPLHNQTTTEQSHHQRHYLFGLFKKCQAQLISGNLFGRPKQRQIQSAKHLLMVLTGRDSHNHNLLPEQQMGRQNSFPFFTKRVWGERSMFFRKGLCKYFKSNFYV